MEVGEVCPIKGFEGILEWRSCRETKAFLPLWLFFRENLWQWL
jgi:hypothetical protein